jgi:IMP dehydrogenase
MIARLTKDGKVFGVAVGLLDNGDGELEVVLSAIEVGVPIICLDVANGHNLYTIKSTATLAGLAARRTRIMSGCVASVDGWNSLCAAGADYVRVGIGSGAACSTRRMTGVGVPQASLIRQIYYDGVEGPILVADGGIRYPGDIIKALALGAEAVMAGWLLSGAVECGNDGWYRGQASRSVQEDKFGYYRSIEGLEIRISNTEPLADILARIKSNMQSGMSYIGANHIGDICSQAEFVEVGHTSLKDFHWLAEKI